MARRWKEIRLTGGKKYKDRVPETIWVCMYVSVQVARPARMGLVVGVRHARGHGARTCLCRHLSRCRVLGAFVRVFSWVCLLDNVRSLCVVSRSMQGECGGRGRDVSWLGGGREKV